MTKPHYYGHRERLKKKYFEKGIEALNEYEILELLLFYSIPRKDTKKVAKELLNRFKNIKGVFENLFSEEIEKVHGFGKNSLIFLRIIRDIFSIIEKQKIFETKKLDNLEKVIKYAKVSITGLKHEELRVLCLNSKNEIIDDVVVEKGIINEVYIYPRKIVEIAIKKNATSLILIHNHPSGNVKPSKADILLTKKLKEILNAINVTLHDHIIVSQNNFYSFKLERII